MASQGQQGDLSALDLPPRSPSSGPLLFALHSELPDQCSPDPCDKKGTHVCQDLMGNFYCQCRDGWAGRLCSRGEAASPGEMGPPLGAAPGPGLVGDTATPACPAATGVRRLWGAASCVGAQDPRWSALKGQMGGRDPQPLKPPGGLDIWAAGVLPLPQAGLRPA